MVISRELKTTADIDVDTPVESHPPSANMGQEVSSNDDVVGVREYMSDLEDSVSTATETSNTSVEDLNQEQQFADVEELNHE